MLTEAPTPKSESAKARLIAEIVLAVAAIGAVPFLLHLGIDASQNPAFMGNRATQQKPIELVIPIIDRHFTLK